MLLSQWYQSQKSLDMEWSVTLRYNQVKWVEVLQTGKINLNRNHMLKLFNLMFSLQLGKIEPIVQALPVVWINWMQGKIQKALEEPSNRNLNNNLRLKNLLHKFTTIEILLEFLLNRELMKEDQFLVELKVRKLILNSSSLFNLMEKELLLGKLHH